MTGEEDGESHQQLGDKRGHRHSLLRLVSGKYMENHMYVMGGILKLCILPVYELACSYLFMP